MSLHSKITVRDIVDPVPAFFQNTILEISQQISPFGEQIQLSGKRHIIDVTFPSDTLISADKSEVYVVCSTILMTIHIIYHFVNF